MTRVLQDQWVARVSKGASASKGDQVLRGLLACTGGKVLMAILACRDGQDLQGSVVNEEIVELMDLQDLL